MVAWWEWIAWMATVCVAVRLGSVVAGWHERERLATVPVRVHARHDATGR